MVLVPQWAKKELRIHAVIQLLKLILTSFPLQQELDRLEVLKRENLQALTESTRSDIAVLWDKCYFSLQQRHEFTQACDEHYTEKLLAEHENELERLQVTLQFNTK